METNTSKLNVFENLEMNTWKLDILEGPENKYWEVFGNKYWESNKLGSYASSGITVTDY